MGEKIKDSNFEEIREHVIKQIKDYMDVKEITVTKFAKRCGMTQSALSKVLHGQSAMTLKHIVAFAEAMECDPGLLLTRNAETRNFMKNLSSKTENNPIQQLVVDASSEGLITNCESFSFKGMLGEYKFYAYPTISTEFKILRGTLNLRKADTKDKSCLTTLKINTGTVNERGEEIFKIYEGKTINSLPMQCTFSTLISVDNADFVFLSWHHRFMTNIKLQSRMAACLTASAGSERRPVMLKVIISRIELSDDDIGNLFGEMKMNGSNIHIKKSKFDDLCDRAKITSTEKDLFGEQVFTPNSLYQIYDIQEDKISILEGLDTDRKNELIGLLRKESLNTRYIKVANKSDTRLYEYIMKKQREEYQNNMTDD